jgi:hypothetical protein
VFLDDEEIKRLYERKVLTVMPSYDYGPELMRYISRELLLHQDGKYFHDGLGLGYLEVVEQVQVLVENQGMSHLGQGKTILSLIMAHKE